MSTPVASVTATTPAAPASPDQAKLKKAAQAFEAVFLRQMIGSMRTSSLGDGILDSSASQQFRDMSDSKLADSMAQKGALHIADMLVKQFGARVSPAAGPTASAHPEEGLSLPKTRLEGPATALRDAVSTGSTVPQDERAGEGWTP